MTGQVDRLPDYAVDLGYFFGEQDFAGLFDDGRVGGHDRAKTINR